MRVQRKSGKSDDIFILKKIVLIQTNMIFSTFPLGSSNMFSIYDSTWDYALASIVRRSEWTRMKELLGAGIRETSDRVESVL